jgi:hypothetical protein
MKIGAELWKAKYVFRIPMLGPEEVDPFSVSWLWRRKLRVKG